jgi:hypothetical protein
VLPTQEGDNGNCACCGRLIRTLFGTFRTPACNGGYYVYGVEGGGDRHAVGVDLLLRAWAAGQFGPYVGVAVDYYASGSSPLTLVDAPGRAIAGGNLPKRSLRSQEVDGTAIGQAALDLAAAILRTDERVARLCRPGDPDTHAEPLAGPSNVNKNEDPGSG